MPWLTRLLLFGAAWLTLQAAVAAAPARPHPAAHIKQIRGGGHYMFIAYGDTRSYPDDHRKVIAAIVRLHPEFVLQTGDLVATGTNAAQWAEFDAITKPLRDARIAYYPARGNHDVGPYYASRVSEPFDSGNTYYYAFTRHGSRFLMLDSMDPDEFAPGSAQYEWIVNELAKAQKTALNTFVLFHEPPYSVGPHGPTPDALRYLHPLFVKYKPRAVFCGHDHLYYRTTRDGVTYFVTGGGGAPLYTPDRAAQVAIPGDVYASVHHVIRCDVDGSRVTFTAVALDRDPTLTTPWAKTDAQPIVTLVGPNGVPSSKPVPATPGGSVIDRLTLGPK